MNFKVDAVHLEDSEKDTDYDTLVKKLTEYFIYKRNLTHERAHFHERKRGKEETVEDFVRELHARVAHCDYKDPDKQVRECFVGSLRDTTVKRKLELINKNDTEQGGVYYKTTRAGQQTIS